MVPNPIKQDFIPGLPERPYRNGVGAWEGVCIHDTECPGDSDESEVAYFKQNWQTRKAFVHGFVDADSITQTAKWEYVSWGCGNGNPRFINLEMCMASNQSDFDAIYRKTCALAASKLYERKLGVTDEKTLVSHNWVAKNIGGTDHTDPIAYLQKWGKTWSDMVKDVRAAYDALSKPAGSVEYKMTAEDANNLIKTYLGPAWQAAHDKGDTAGMTETGRLADELRKASNQPTQN